MGRNNGYTKLIETMVASQAAIQATLGEQATALAKLGQKMDDTHDRLFGDEGVIPRLAAGMKRIESSSEAAIKELAAKHEKLNTKVTWYAGIGTGVSITLSTFGKSMLSKLGWHL